MCTAYEASHMFICWKEISNHPLCPHNDVLWEGYLATYSNVIFLDIIIGIVFYLL